MAFTQVTITQDFNLADGVEPSGTVTFTPVVPMLNGGVVIPAAPVVARLVGDGTISISLAANTDVGTTPAGSAYSVVELINGVRRAYNIQIPTDQGSTVTLYALAQLATPPGLSFPVAGRNWDEPAFVPTGFVYRQGAQLKLGSASYRVLGANVYDLLDSSTSEANTRLTELQGHGINTVRCWAFSNNGTAETAMRTRLATALSNASAKGIRLLLTLGNYFTDWGGPTSFGLDQTTWFQTLNQTWLDQIEVLVAQFASSTAVLGWEILNEPRPNNDVPSMQWLEIAAGRIRRVDPYHLISSGSEGFVPYHYPTPTAQSSASPDINMTALNSGGTIDVASAHLYTKYLTPDFAPNAARTLAALTTQKKICDGLRKPLIIGECGFDPGDFGGTTSRAQFIHHVAAAANYVGAAGGFLWNWGRLADVGSFTLAQGDTSSETLINDWVATLTSGDPGSVVSTHVTGQVATGADDTYHSFNGVSTHVYNNTGGDVAVGLFDTGQTQLGAALRFTGLAIPHNAVIQSASLKLVASASDSATTVRSKLRAVAADNASIPANDTAFHAPGYTTAVVNWDSIPAWTNGTTYTSPDISTVIQEIVNRSGWSSGNAIVLLWDDLDQRSTQSSGVVRRGQSYNNTPANAPVLTVTYTV